MVVLYAPSYMPSISHAFSLQVQLNYHGADVSSETVVRIGGMTKVSETCFPNLINALHHAWRSGKYYFIILKVVNFPFGHCLAFAPNGFILNPNQGLFQFMSVEAAYSNLRLDPAVVMLGSRPSGSIVRLVEVSKKRIPMHARFNRYPIAQCP